MGRIAKPWYFDSPPYMSSVVDSTLTEGDPDNSSEGDMSIEVISPPRQPITRSVSAKRAADEMQPDDDGDDDALLISSPPRPVMICQSPRSFPFSFFHPLS